MASRKKELRAQLDLRKAEAKEIRNDLEELRNDSESLMRPTKDLYLQLALRRLLDCHEAIKQIEAAIQKLPLEEQ